MKKTETGIAKPFVKWVGGKTQLLDKVKELLPKNFAEREGITYIEPFVGGGAVLFWILQTYPNIKKAIINDINTELICTYRVIKKDVHSLIEELKKLQTEYLSLDNKERKDFFLEQRTLFNTKTTTDIQTATLFIFLNKTCFNGLYRV
ncbi:MAG TPA: modification methylase, partial [Porphyromonadaceae bacterium]|nr:modification methylase [Porphyromonadaceae bacterium]